MLVKGLDHIVLTVADIDATCEFYTSILGMTRETFGGGRTGLSFGPQKINLHKAGKEFDPHADRPAAGSADFCLLVESVAHAEARLKEKGIAIVEGPVPKTGALGPMTSVYCRDPDGNLVELAEYRKE
jgi:catechol 2,3-dioxygenase-like lactoylglutathione lyase family enzyme